jgi:hypothetical protein
MINLVAAKGLTEGIYRIVPCPYPESMFELEEHVDLSALVPPGPKKWSE